MNALALLFLSSVLISPSVCFGHAFHDCTKKQARDIRYVVDNAKHYLTLAREYENPDLFEKWMGFNEIEEIKRTFVYAHEVLVDAKVDFYCGSGPYYALSSPKDNYIITLGDKFWSAKLDGFNSKTGTIIHELTHFNSVAGTVDNFLAYFPEEALTQARIDSGQEIVLHNANSYEYLAEDIFLHQRPSYKSGSGG